MLHVFLGLRIHRVEMPKDAESLATLMSKLSECLNNCADYASEVGIAFDASDKDLEIALTINIDEFKVKIGGKPNIRCIPVSPWGRYIPALNGLLRVASEMKMHRIMYQSLEIRTTRKEVMTILNTMDNKTLLAGKALNGHEFESCRKVAIGGLTCPWNTFAIWNIEYLSRTGFLMVSDGAIDGKTFL